MRHETKLIQDGQETTFALVFDAVKSRRRLASVAKDHRLSGAHLTAIGARERLTLGFFDVTKRNYKKIAIQEQVELMSLIGNIAQDDKRDPKLHAHVVVGKSDGTANGGHLVDATFDRPWKSWLPKRRSICAARCAANRPSPAGSVVIAAFMIAFICSSRGVDKRWEQLRSRAIFRSDPPDPAPWLYGGQG